MNRCVPPRRRSNLVAASATTGFVADRLKRATTVWPDGIREVDEKPAGLSVVRREGETKQPTLSTRVNCARQVEKIGREDRSVAHNPDPSALLNDELHGPVGGILDKRNR